MPIVENSTYRPPLTFKNPHVNTIYAALMRRAPYPEFKRERIDTPDGDFLDLDWSKTTIISDKIVICTHGLEGGARKPYMRGMMHRFNLAGFDALGINLRGCSGEDNRFLSGYHSGRSDDLAHVVNYVSTKNYRQIVLIGFSIGGNITLKYVGEMGEKIPQKISHTIAFAVPCDLSACSLEFEKAKNIVYLMNFLKTLREKAFIKARKYPNQVNRAAISRAFTFRAFDDAFTAPVNGYRDAQEYWQKASCLPFLKNIAVPTLLVSAKDDSFLAPSCYPIALAKSKSNFFLEMPEKGGHMGFMSPDTEGYLWSEHRAIDFVNKI
ncbi:MAG: alpha/beta fold hydrolase [Saprospiraceae bacterium]|nr:alpha/beta fold hydrolase [Saprospiraceae bacterium]